MRGLSETLTNHIWRAYLSRDPKSPSSKSSSKHCAYQPHPLIYTSSAKSPDSLCQFHSFKAGNVRTKPGSSAGVEGLRESQRPSIRRLIEDAVRLCRISFFNIPLTFESLSRKTNLPKKSKTVTEKRWELELATMATTFGFPFEVINHPQFQSLLLVNAKLFLEKAKLPFKISAAVEMPLNVTLEDHIRARAEGQQKDVLQKLPLNAKLSLSLNLWTSPWRGVEFLVISGYFIDSDWNYREALLGFEPLYRKFTQNPRAVLLGILQAHRIQDRILAITTDLASKHADTVATMQELTQGFAVDYVGVSIIGIPSLTHIIQLSLKELLGKMNAHPQNKNVETVWTERHCQEACGWAQQKDINTTLAKVRYNLS